MIGKRNLGEACSLRRCRRRRRSSKGANRSDATAKHGTEWRHPRTNIKPPPGLAPIALSWWALAVVAAAAMLPLASVAHAGAPSDGDGGSESSGGFSGGRSGRSVTRSLPWWYPSIGWDMLPSDNQAGGWQDAGGGGGGWAALGYPRRRYREEAKLAGELVGSWVANGVAEEEEREGKGGEGGVVMPVCHAHEAGNHTLRKLGAGVDRCASPYFSLAEIHPSQLVYTEVDPAVEAAKVLKEQEQEEKRRRKEQERAESGEGYASGREGEEEEEEDEGDEGEEDSFLGIFLFLKGDFFSLELENSLTAVMSAYPRAWVVKANAASFLSFCVQYDLHTFPQLLLFRNGHLVSRYRGKRSPEGLAAWFSLLIGDLPRAIPRRPLPPPPPPHPLSPPGMDEPLTWLALLYAAAKIATAIGWFIKRRRRGVGEEGPRRRRRRVGERGTGEAVAHLR